MYDLIARFLPRRLVLWAFLRMYNHCRFNDDPELRNDAQHPESIIIQWWRVIHGEVEENR